MTLASPSSPPVKIMVVDDSAIIRGLLTKIIDSDPAFEITSTAPNGEIAIANLRKEKHDIILLDVEMPVMDGLTAIKQLLEIQPNIKIIMCSTLTTKNAETTLRALSLGAVDCIAKPTTTQDIYAKDAFREILIHTLKEIGGITKRGAAEQPEPKRGAHRSVEQSSKPGGAAYKAVSRADKTVKIRGLHEGYSGKPDILAIGSSTGGPNALFEVIPHLKGIQIPVIITQHMPPTFTRILAEHIHQQTGIDAVEGAEGMPLLPGRIHIAPGGYHMLFKKNGAATVITLDEGPMENFCRPAVDPMLRSAVKIYGQRIMTVILTGMGQDGMLGAREVIGAGGRVIAQDEATSVVWGMPGAVAVDGTCTAVLPLKEIGPWLRKSSLRLV